MNIFTHSMVLLALASLPASPREVLDAQVVANSMQQEPWVDGAVYRLIAAPGQISSIALEPGEKLISVAAGDTSRWIIGDTSSGGGSGPSPMILVKPLSAGLKTNLIITTDRRSYQLALESRGQAPMASLRWTYGSPGIIALRTPIEEKPAPDIIRTDPERLNFNYRVEGDQAPWRPVRVFDDGQQTFIEFPLAIGQGEAPPLFLKGGDGKLELVNYRVKGRFYVLDRIIAAAELRLGEAKGQRVSIVREAAHAAVARRLP